LQKKTTADTVFPAFKAICHESKHGHSCVRGEVIKSSNLTIINYEITIKKFGKCIFTVVLS
jgi:hypothetical protein